jgi:hypothetical protein
MFVTHGRVGILTIGFGLLSTASCTVAASNPDRTSPGRECEP